MQNRVPVLTRIPNATVYTESNKGFRKRQDSLSELYAGHCLLSEKKAYFWATPVV